MKVIVESIQKKNSNTTDKMKSRGSIKVTKQYDISN
jgi:hypothetical protein